VERGSHSRSRLSPASERLTPPSLLLQFRGPSSQDWSGHGVSILDRQQGYRGMGPPVADPLPNLDRVWNLQPRVGIHMMNSEPTGEPSASPRVWSPSARVQRLALSPPLQRHTSTESVSQLVGVAPLGERSDGAARLSREFAVTASGAAGVSDMLSVASNVPLPSAGVGRGAVPRQPVDAPASETRRSILGAFSNPTGGDTAMVV
jgi:hypothetical protein